jgi:hypothetical protein
MKKLSILFLLMTWAFTVHAQDVITLKNGNEIKAKVTEISSSEIKYKRFDNLEGPTVVVPKSDVFAINYENGTREVINAISSASSTAPAGRTAPAATGPHQKDFYTGIYVNPLTALTVGPIVGVEFTIKRRFIIEGHLRFPSAGLFFGQIWEGEDVTDVSGIGVGLHAKYFTGGNKGGFYVGPFLEFWKTTYYLEDGNSFYDGSGVIFAAMAGYKFQFSSGFYMRTGGFLGVCTGESSYSRTGNVYNINTPFYGLELSIGIAF